LKLESKSVSHRARVYHEALVHLAWFSKEREEILHVRYKLKGLHQQNTQGTFLLKNKQF